MDAWFEEDEEVFVYPRDPYKRVDILQSSCQVQVVIDDMEIANSKRPGLLFETGLPTRYDVPNHVARLVLLGVHPTCGLDLREPCSLSENVQ